MHGRLYTEATNFFISIERLSWKLTVIRDTILSKVSRNKGGIWNVYGL